MAHALVPGNPDLSEVFVRVSSKDSNLVMPPHNSNLKLSQHEIDLIEKLRDRASRFMRNMIELESSKIANLAARPVLRDPAVMITSRLEIITSLRDRSIRSFQGRLAIAQEELQQVTARVRALSPQATLDRGYAVVQLVDGSIARDSAALKDGEKLRIRLAQGETSAMVTS